LAGENDLSVDSSALGQRLGFPDLLGVPPHHEKPYPRFLFGYAPQCIEEKLESLVRLACARVKDHRGALQPEILPEVLYFLRRGRLSGLGKG
jgi:hypothetical protein